MKNLETLLEEREILEAKTAEMLTIVRGTEEVEKRELTEEETTSWSELKESRIALDKSIKLAEEMQNEERILAAKSAPKHEKVSPEAKLAADMSIVRGIQNLMNNKY